MSAMEERIEDLLGQMTLEEKAAVAGGSAMWHSTPIPRLGIPRLKVSDGPIGVRGGHEGSGVAAACFPNGSALAATWNPELIEQVGVAIGQEARTKSVHVVLGPTVNLHRSPLGGRHFECYSEDPLLSARMAVAWVRGVQSQGVGTSVKHYVCNDSEFERHTISSEVSESALRELYLVPFEATVREARPWTIMAAYNRVNGTFATEHRELQVDVLKNEWGFDGLIVSDWFAVKNTVGAANGGLDLEMPGPARFFGPPLAQAVKDGAVAETELDDKVRRVLRMLLRAGAFEQEGEQSEEAVDSPEHRAIARQVATEAAVLLKNDGDVLPLTQDILKRLAVVGPNAERTAIQGGGSARVLPHYEISILDALRDRAAGRFELVHETGCSSHKSIPVISASRVGSGIAGRSGFAADFFDNLELAGTPVFSRVSRNMDHTWFGSFDRRLDPARFSVRFRGSFTPDESGTHSFALTSAGRSRLFVDGELLIDNWTDPVRGEAWYGTGSREEIGEIAMAAGKPVDLSVEYTKEGALVMGGLKLGYLPPQPADMMERAVAAAEGADAVVVVVGLNAEWETEGHDKDDMRLPGRQAELIERVAAVNPKTVVVLNAGTPTDMAWIDGVPAVLQSWYGGQEAGNALADLLFGDANPSGRLPTTFPLRVEDNPAHSGDPLTYPGVDGHVSYAEELLLGYRHFDARGIEPRFCFGHGLSYTTFEYGDAELNGQVFRADDPVEVSVAVHNTGAVEGLEVVQLYLSAPADREGRPPIELRGLAKVALAPGETRRVTLSLDRRALSCWDPAAHAWVVPLGEREILVGHSSRDIRSRARFRLVDE